MTEPGEGGQLPLPFSHSPEFAAADFIEAPSNADALAWLDRSETWPDRRLVVWGEPGCGKTHLLHLWAARTGAVWRDGLSLSSLPEAAAALVIDNADAALDEAVLLHTLNRAAVDGCTVLLSGRAAPGRWPIQLRDLASRIRAITAVGIAPPEDSLLRILLARLLADRQLSVPPQLQDWLVLRLPRTQAAVRQAVERLDRAQLSTGRSVTKALATAILAEIEGSGQKRPGGGGE